MELADLSIALSSLQDFTEPFSVDETGNTFEENAILKAREYGRHFGLPAVADDGGLEIEALHGEPGVKTRLWLDPKREATDEELVHYCLERMKGEKNRLASLTTVVAFFDGNQVYTKRASIEGTIVNKQPEGRIEPGYPFRLLLFIPQYGKVFQDLTKEEHLLINHRRKAIRALKPTIAAYYAHKQ